MAHWNNWSIKVSRVENGYVLTVPKLIGDIVDGEQVDVERESESVIEGEDTDTLVRVLQEVRDYFDSNAKVIIKENMSKRG